MTLVSLSNDDEYTRYTSVEVVVIMLYGERVPHSAHNYSHAQYRKRVYLQTLLANQMSFCTILANEKEVSVLKRHIFVKIIIFQQRYHQVDTFLNFS